MAKSNEPIWWSLFAAGGGLAAMLLPIHILLFGIAYPLEWVDRAPFGYQQMAALAANPLVKLYLLALISLPLFHAAHRIKFTLVDLGLKDARLVLSLLCYGGAIAGTLYSVVLLLRI